MELEESLGIGRRNCLYSIVSSRRHRRDNLAFVLDCSHYCCRFCLFPVAKDERRMI